MDNFILLCAERQGGSSPCRALECPCPGLEVLAVGTEMRCCWKEGCSGKWITRAAAKGSFPGEASSLTGIGVLTYWLLCCGLVVWGVGEIGLHLERGN